MSELTITRDSKGFYQDPEFIRITSKTPEKSLIKWFGSRQLAWLIVALDDDVAPDAKSEFLEHGTCHKWLPTCSVDNSLLVAIFLRGEWPVAVFAVPHHYGAGRAIEDISAERNRQVSKEGFSTERDDGYQNHELARAAAVYAMPSGCTFKPASGHPPAEWPWDPQWYKPAGMSISERRRELVKAGALLVAEIERVDRLMLGVSD